MPGEFLAVVSPQSVYVPEVTGEVRDWLQLYAADLRAGSQLGSDRPAADRPEGKADSLYNGVVERAFATLEKRGSQRRALWGRTWRPTGWWKACAGCVLRWHLCSLDAPTVAVVWAVALGRPAGARVPWPELAVLALGTWIVYVLDRVLDGVQSDAGRPGGSPRLEARHLFARRHRRRLLCLCCLAAALLVPLCAWLPRTLVGFYLLLGIPVAIYGILVHTGAWHGVLEGGRKEAAVALLFTAAVAAPAFVAAAPGARFGLLGGAVLLALLCRLNLAFISHAESQRGRAGPQRRLIAAGCAALAMAAAVGCGACLDRPDRGAASLLFQVLPPMFLPVLFSVLLSALLLAALLLGRVGQTRRGSRLRVLADIALLTPLLFFFVS